MEDPLPGGEFAVVARDFLEREWSLERLSELGSGQFPRGLWRQAERLGWFSALDLVGDEEGPNYEDVGALVMELGRSLFPGPVVGTLLAAVLLRDEVRSGMVPFAPIFDAEAALQPVSLQGGHTYLLVPYPNELRGVVLAIQTKGGPEFVLARVEEHAEVLHSQDVLDQVARVTLNELSVEEKLVVERSEVERHLVRCSYIGRALICARLVGMAAALLDDSVSYSRGREQFDRPIATFQAVQHRLADMYVSLVLSRSATQSVFAALSTDDHKTLDQKSRAAKAFVSRRAQIIAEDALQIHGGVGFTAEHHLHRYLKHILTLSSAWGDARTHERWLGMNAFTRAST